MAMLDSSRVPGNPKRPRGSPPAPCERTAGARVAPAPRLPEFGLAAPARRRHDCGMADTTAFDTLATARRLKAAGFNDAQAEAQAEAIAAAVRAGRGELASKADIVGLKADIADLEARFYRALLALGAALVGIMVAVGLMQALG